MIGRRTLALALAMCLMLTAFLLWVTRRRAELSQTAAVYYSPLWLGTTLNVRVSPREDRRLRRLQRDEQDADAANRLRRLLGQGANPNVIDSFDGHTLVAGYALAGGPRAVKTLLAAGADINALGADGRTALMWAAYNGNPRMVQLLLENGAHPSLRSNAGGGQLPRLQAGKTACDLAKVRAGDKELKLDDFARSEFAQVIQELTEAERDEAAAHRSVK